MKKYYEAWNRALVSLDSKELKAMSLPTCEACAADLYDLEAFKTKGQTVQGGAITVSNLKGLPGLSQGSPCRKPDQGPRQDLQQWGLGEVLPARHRNQQALGRRPKRRATSDEGHLMRARHLVSAMVALALSPSRRSPQDSQRRRVQ